MAEPSGVSVHTPDDVKTWLRSGQRHVYIGDVLDETNSDSMGVGFARYAPGESNEWVVTYDETLIITSGVFSVTSQGERHTATAGQVIFLRAGTEVVYGAGDEGAELVYIMYPHPSRTDLATRHADLVATFQPADAPPPRFADGQAEQHIALLRRINDPLERGESYDYQPFYDALAEDAVLDTSVMRLEGKRAVIDYFAEAGQAVDFNPFERPLQYFGSGNRVVQWGIETFHVKATGLAHRAEWAWVYEFRSGQISRITAIQDLSAIAEIITEAAAKAQARADAIG
ncbi:MAG TPA: nuclear transport factor 2 family protein [Pilimelia sp.]|nr:nuclear transport factor 2 family protein [Pilimelia sp.]